MTWNSHRGCGGIVRIVSMNTFEWQSQNLYWQSWAFFMGLRVVAIAKEKARQLFDTYTWVLKLYFMSCCNLSKWICAWGGLTMRSRTMLQSRVGRFSLISSNLFKYSIHSHSGTQLSNLWHKLGDFQDWFTFLWIKLNSNVELTRYSHICRGYC